MKLFVYKITAFLAMSVLTVYGIEQVIRHRSAKEFHHELKYNEIYNKKEKLRPHGNRWVTWFIWNKCKDD